MPFEIVGFDNLLPTVRFADGVTVSARRLSGGQKVLLALAFRIGLNLELAEDLGILCLDEPTAGLDRDNLDCVEKGISRLREIGQARGLQFIMITHEHRLDHLCSAVIDLSVGAGLITA